MMLCLINFCGDDGDCVPSFYNWYKDGRKVRITPGKEKKVREIIGINTVQDLVDSEYKLKPVFEKVCKRDINDIDFSERLMRQRVLVELNSKLFPEYIQDYKESLDYMIGDIPSESFGILNHKYYLRVHNMKDMIRRKQLKQKSLKEWTST